MKSNNLNKQINYAKLNEPLTTDYAWQIHKILNFKDMQV